MCACFNDNFDACEVTIPRLCGLAVGSVAIVCVSGIAGTPRHDL